MSSAELSAIIDGTKKRIDRDVQLGMFTYSANAESGAGPTSTVTIGNYQFPVDELEAFGGNGTAPGPPEFVLGGLLACQIVTLSFRAAKLGLTVGTVSSHTEGTLDLRGMFRFDDSVDVGFKDIKVTVTITGPHSRDEYNELLKEAEKHCPMSDTIAHAIATHITLG